MFEKERSCMTARPLSELVEQLPPHMQREVRDFVDFLLARHGREPGKMPRQDWAAALRDHRRQYSALELQKKALEWRGH
jgi:hypothetical protein